MDQQGHLRMQVGTIEKFDIRFPRAAEDQYDQDEEWCEVRLDGGEFRRLRFHDYHEIYGIPGLYEQIFYEELKCDSPRLSASCSLKHLEASGRDPEDLRVLDVGAGNGMVGEQLKELGRGHDRGRRHHRGGRRGHRARPAGRLRRLQRRGSHGSRRRRAA